MYTTPTVSHIDDITLDYELLPSGDAKVYYNITVVPQVPSLFQVNLYDAIGRTVATATTPNGYLLVTKGIWNLQFFFTVFRATNIMVAWQTLFILIRNHQWQTRNT